MRRIVALALAVVLIFVGMSSASAESVTSFSEKISSMAILAAEYLESVRVPIGSSCTALGFSSEVFMNMTVGTPFVVHRFTEEGEIISDDIYMCPLIYNGDIVGQIEIYYDPISLTYCYSMGTAYAEPLDDLVQTSVLSNGDNLVFGNMGDKFFATDGQSVFVLFDAPIEDECIELSQIEQQCKNIKLKASKNSTSVKSITSSQVVTATQVNTQQTRGTNGLLAVPHVAQNGGICGVAAWASVLNFRFNTTYTTYTLTNAMTDSGYRNGSTGIPNMSDYKNFANDVYNAGCVTTASPPSFSRVEAAIDAGKPIMGAWYSGTGSSKVCHAILIVGYLEKSDGYLYYIKNPWYVTTSVISVSSSSNVVCVDGTYTWTLSTVVY